MTPPGPAGHDPGPSAPSDAELLVAHVSGSSTAFGDLMVRHQDRLWAVALRMMRNPDDASDVLQDAALKAFRHADSFRGQSQVSTWLHRIVVNTALDALRRSARVGPAPFEAPEPRDPHDRMSEREAALDVTAALAELPPDQRAAVILVDMQGFSVTDAAHVLGCAVGTVKSRCFRARRRLADLLPGYGSSDGGSNDSAAPAGNQIASPDVQPTTPSISGDDSTTSEAPA